jgi:hypothetical protein
MRVGDLVRPAYTVKPFFDARKVGIIVDFVINYDRFGDPTEKLAIVNWGDRCSNEKEYMDGLEVINESR